MVDDGYGTPKDCSDYPHSEAPMSELKREQVARELAERWYETGDIEKWLMTTDTALPKGNYSLHLLAQWVAKHFRLAFMKGCQLDPEATALRAQLAQVEQQLHDLSTSHFELMAMDAEHHSRALGAEKQLAQAQATIEAKDTEIGKQDAEIIVMKATIARLEASHAEALQWQDYLTQSRNTLEQQRDALQRQVAELTARLEQEP